MLEARSHPVRHRFQGSSKILWLAATVLSHVGTPATSTTALLGNVISQITGSHSISFSLGNTGNYRYFVTIMACQHNGSCTKFTPWLPHAPPMLCREVATLEHCGNTSMASDDQASYPD